MRLLILTTDTKHHTYFINEIAKTIDDIHVIYETRQLLKPYVTGPFFLEDQDNFEEKFFINSPRKLPKYVRDRLGVYETCNDQKCISHIRAIEPDIIISFGTGLLSPETYNIANICALNIHRGYISEYRGLDSDLWALYNNEFNKIGVTIHHLTKKLDAGNVIEQKTLNLDKKVEIFHLRYLTTLLATEMMQDILISLLGTNKIPSSIAQRQLGKYYTAMPLEKKAIAKQNLDLYFENKKKKLGTILLYHGVTNSESIGVENFSHKHIDATAFREQMKYIRDNLVPVSLRKMLVILNEQRSDSRKYVAVTFDDSFKNVHDVALPILEEFSIPATFFITTGMVGTSKKYWVDHLEDMINHAQNHHFTLMLDTKKEYKLSNHEKKIKCISEIKTFLKTASSSRRRIILSDIERKTSWQPHRSKEVDNYQNLSWDDVIKLDKSPLCEVGGHTVNHEIMSYLNDEELDFEINGCLDELEKKLARKIDLFSYPEGQHEHYNEKVINKLKEAGVVICPSAIGGYNGVDEDPFHLKRIMVGFMDRKFPFDMGHQYNV